MSRPARSRASRANGPRADAFRPTARLRGIAARAAGEQGQDAGGAALLLVPVPDGAE